jgi:UDP-N-acetylglucosamine 1-carboxyvinyltransferase
MIVGPLLARFGKASIPKPGGDKIGRRRLDTHFLGFEKLGARFNYNPDNGFYNVDASNLQGTYILLDEASVTGTANIVMAAVLAKGTTTIYNAACEPYLQQLCKMLNRMGAKISGIGIKPVNY